MNHKSTALKSFSIVLITYNEERNIARVLNSVKDLSDDIIVVDSGSVDKTIEICKNHAVRLFQRSWEGYAPTKNFANQQAKYSWVLSLDADEALSPRLKESIMKRFDSKGSSNTVYSFNRLTNYCGKWIRHSGWYPDRKIRIWHKNFGEWQGVVHEDLVFKDKPREILLKGDLLHYSFYTIEEHWQKINHFTTLSAETLFAKGKKSNGFKLLLSPSLRFTRDYFIRGGFLDGGTGYHVCRLTAWGTYLKYAKLRALWATARR